MKQPRRLRTLVPRLATLSGRTLTPPPKTADPFYLSPEHRAWSEAVIARAGGRCEALDAHGRRCRKARPRHRMFADHIKERADGGASFDPNNGRCLCGSHHSEKTAEARAARLAAQPSDANG